MEQLREAVEGMHEVYDRCDVHSYVEPDDPRELAEFFYGEGRGLGRVLDFCLGCKADETLHWKDWRADHA